MSTYVSYRDGGKTSEEGFYRPFAKLFSTLGVLGSTDLAVSQRGAGANKSVDIAAGDAFFSYSGYAYYAWNTATVNDSSTVITDNTSGNPRIDAVVAYIDLTVVSSANSNNPSALKFKVVAGTPAGSPSAPSDSDIQSSIGAGNPFIRLANVAVANGFSSIVNANITDTRPQLAFTSFLGNKVLQVKISNSLGQATNGTNNETHWGETSITPKSSTSTIYALLIGSGIDNGGSGRMEIKLRYEGISGGVTGTTIGVAVVAQDSSGTNGVSGASILGSVALGNTNLTYFKATVLHNDTSVTWYAGRYSAESRILLMEVAA